MIPELLIGTNNAHKAREISALLADLNVTVRTPRDFDLTEEPEEDGATFEENARIKARYYAEKTGLPCLADDSGLVVDALNGRPGVFSSRYAPTDPERITRLLGEMAGIEDAARGARFVCAAALHTPRAETHETTIETGKCEGIIGYNPNGDNGFGYDPVFFLPELGRTMAQLPEHEKNTLSHRGRALKAMLPHIKRLFNA